MGVHRHNSDYSYGLISYIPILSELQKSFNYINIYNNSNKNGLIHELPPS